MGKLPLLLLFLSVFLTSTLAIRYTNPEQQHELGQCMERCERLRFSVEKQRECFQECEEKYGRQGRKSSRGDELVELMINPQHHGDQQQKLGQCMERCAVLRFSTEMQRECFQECQEKYGRQGRRSRGDESDDELVELMINPQHHGDQQRYEECRRQCQRQGHRSQGQQWQCQKGCEEKYRRQGGYGERDEEDDDNQGRFDPEMSRKCQQMCRGKGYECQRRCQQGGRSQEDDDNQGRFDPEMSRKCQQMCRGKGYECQRRCQQGGRSQEDDDNQGRFDPEMSRKCQQMCRGKGYECQRRCQQQEDDDNQGRFDPEMSRKCQQMCRGKGYECQRRCQQGGRSQEDDDNQGRMDSRRFEECQQRCLRKGGGGECLSRCIQESQGRRHGGSSLLASILELTRLFD